MKEPFLINPPKNLRVGKRAIGLLGSNKQRQSNPIGETLITVGGNPMNYFHRRNAPQLGVGVRGAMDVQKWAPLALTGALSAVANASIPPMFGLTGEWMNYGAKLAIAFGGGVLIGQFVDKEHGGVWAVVGTSLVAYDVLKKYVLSQFFPQLALSGVGYEYPGYEEQGDSQVNAFPNQVGAYPDYGGVQAFPLGSYPYDGQYGSYETMT